MVTLVQPRDHLRIAVRPSPGPGAAAPGTVGLRAESGPRSSLLRMGLGARFAVAAIGIGAVWSAVVLGLA